MSEAQVREVMEVAKQQLDNLRPFADVDNPPALKPDKFHTLLDLAKAAFPESETIQRMPRFTTPSVTVVELVEALSGISGVAKATVDGWSAARAREENKRWSTRSPYLQRRPDRW
jgi:hypothetical protein